MQKITNDLLALAQNGDETAVAALIARMMPAIRKGAAAATAPGLDFEDAVQEGLIGLFEAMHRYDTDFRRYWGQVEIYDTGKRLNPRVLRSPQFAAGAGQGVGNGFGSQLLFLGDLSGGLAV